MYLEFFRLDRMPFHITPDPDFLFPSPSHNEALAAIVYGVENRKGFVALTGEVGTGKTTILRAYLRREEGTDIRPIYLFHPDLSFRDLVVKLLRELGLETGEGSTSEFLERLQVQLIDEYRADRTPVLIIDEAQNMPNETLEQLRMLTNLETSKDKLLQVVLVGQPELEEILDQHSLRQLKQRIAVRATIQPLTVTESAAYIRSRVERAGGDAKYLFSDSAIKEIVRLANGIPRTINTVCDNALIAGYGMQQRPVPAKTVREAGRDLQLDVGKRSLVSPFLVVGALAAAAAILLGAYFYMKNPAQQADDPGAYAMESDTAPLPEPEAIDAPPASNESESVIDAVMSAPEPSAMETSTAVSVNEPDPVEALADEIWDRAVSREDAGNNDVIGARPLEVVVTPVQLDAADDLPSIDVPPPVAATPVAADTPAQQPPPPPQIVAATADVTPRSTPAPSNSASIVTRLVEPGDCLSKLIADVYETENYQVIMQAVMRHNPGISDPDALPVGLSIDFPALPQAQRDSL